MSSGPLAALLGAPAKTFSLNAGGVVGRALATGAVPSSTAANRRNDLGEIIGGTVRTDASSDVFEV